MKEIIIDKTQTETLVLDKTDRPHIIFLLDESGSMISLLPETIDNFNLFLTKQKELADECYMTLILFSANYQIIYKKKNIKDIENLTNKTYKPSGYTPLYDAIGKTIADVKDEEPLVVILTDGQENSSKEYTKEQIKNLIEQKEREGWEFMYLGANQDAFAEAGGIGISFQNTQNWTANAIGTQSAFTSISVNSLRYRNNYKKN